mmetsp:Transcript_3943/g.12875  ORF Transcript_3943/g.12875 Transcript_3943/m.12875 type:complete len:238 (+) Transcript_3943:441-1154(+)
MRGRRSFGGGRRPSGFLRFRREARAATAARRATRDSWRTTLSVTLASGGTGPGSFARRASPTTCVERPSTRHPSRRIPRLCCAATIATRTSPFRRRPCSYAEGGSSTRTLPRRRKPRGSGGATPPRDGTRRVATWSTTFWTRPKKTSSSCTPKESKAASSTTCAAPLRRPGTRLIYLPTTKKKMMTRLRLRRRRQKNDTFRRSSTLPRRRRRRERGPRRIRRSKSTSRCRLRTTRTS